MCHTCTFSVMAHVTCARHKRHDEVVNWSASNKMLSDKIFACFTKMMSEDGTFLPSVTVTLLNLIKCCTYTFTARVNQLCFDQQVDGFCKIS